MYSSDYIVIGPVPCDESCAQLGADDFDKRARKECRAFVNQLWRLLEKEKGITKESAPEGFRIGYKGFPHEYGMYYEVVIYFLVGKDSEELAYWVDGQCPEKWDEQAIVDLCLL